MQDFFQFGAEKTADFSENQRFFGTKLCFRRPILFTSFDPCKALYRPVFSAQYVAPPLRSGYTGLFPFPGHSFIPPPILLSPGGSSAERSTAPGPPCPSAPFITRPHEETKGLLLARPIIRRRLGCSSRTQATAPESLSSRICSRPCLLPGDDPASYSGRPSWV